MKITKAVVPVAGLGTRFLPVTKTIPKEMLPIVDKPVVQIVVEQLVNAGVKDIILVTSEYKRAIEDYFDYTYELENKLAAAGKEEALEQIKRVAGLANFTYVRQKGPVGNATPVINCRSLLGGDPFIVVWGDSFVESEPDAVGQLVGAWDKLQASVITGIEHSNPDDANRYGVILGDKIDKNVLRVKEIREKPGPEGMDMPFLATNSGYILTEEIFTILDNLQPGRGGELWLAEAIGKLAQTSAVYARKIEGGVYRDIGNKLEYLKTNILYGLKREDMREELKEFMRGVIRNS